MLALGVPSERLFDVAVAAYLLESNRSSYDVAALSADYLGAPLADAARRTQGVGAPRHGDRAARRGARGTTRGRRVARRASRHRDAARARARAHGARGRRHRLRGARGPRRRRPSGAIEALRAEIHELAGCEFMIDSPKQLAEVLFEKLGLPPAKRTKTGFSTDAACSRRLPPHTRSPRRSSSTASSPSSRAPTSTRCRGCLARTGGCTRPSTRRWRPPGGSRQLESQPAEHPGAHRATGGASARRSCRRRPGDVMVSADYSQIELRILAHLSGDDGLIEAFTSGVDFHTATAARVFGLGARGSRRRACGRGPRRSTSASCTGSRRMGSPTRSRSRAPRPRR